MLTLAIGASFAGYVLRFEDVSRLPNMAVLNITAKICIMAM